MVLRPAWQNCLPWIRISPQLKTLWYMTLFLGQSRNLFLIPEDFFEFLETTFLLCFGVKWHCSGLERKRQESWVKLPLLLFYFLLHLSEYYPILFLTATFLLFHVLTSLILYPFIRPLLLIQYVIFCLNTCLTSSLQNLIFGVLTGN